MQIGLDLPVMIPGLDRDTLHAWCRGIDAGPFSCLAVGERINFPNPCPLSRLPRPRRGACDPAGADDDGGGAARRRPARPRRRHGRARARPHHRRPRRDRAGRGPALLARANRDVRWGGREGDRHGRRPRAWVRTGAEVPPPLRRGRESRVTRAYRSASFSARRTERRPGRRGGAPHRPARRRPGWRARRTTDVAAGRSRSSALANRRFEQLADGRVRYTMKKPWRDGTLGLVVEP